MQTAASIAKRRLRIELNLLSTERTIIRMMLNKRVEYTDSDNNFGPVLYSRDLYPEPCKKQLFDAKGTYGYTENLKGFDTAEPCSEAYLLIDCFSNYPTTTSLAQKLTKWAGDSRKRDHLANFYVIWKPHKKANAQGMRSHPIRNKI